MVWYGVVSCRVVSCGVVWFRVVCVVHLFVSLLFTLSKATAFCDGDEARREVCDEDT